VVRRTSAGLYGAWSVCRTAFDLALIQINTHDLDFDGVAQAEAATGALAGQAMVYRVEVVVVTRQRTDVHQALYIDIGQFDEQAETGHRSDHTREGLAHAVFHELALEPYLAVGQARVRRHDGRPAEEAGRPPLRLVYIGAGDHDQTSSSQVPGTSLVAA